jgi:predicted nucleic acid-binding Zn ribbon protein
MAKRPRMPFPRPLAGVMQDSLTGSGLAERLREAEIWRVWPEVVGSTLAGRAQPLRIINGTLTVAVSSAPWIQELRFMTAMMKEKLNLRLGDEVVKEIVLKAGRVIQPPAEVPEKIHAILPLTSRQQALIENESASITDPETRRAFIELMQACLERGSGTK